MSDYESLTVALEPWFESKITRDKLPRKVRERIKWGFPCRKTSPRNRIPTFLFILWNHLGPGQRREAARQWDCQHDPACEHQEEFWLEVPFRKQKLEGMKVLTQNVAAPDAAALAIRRRMLFYIVEAIDALPNDEKEVRSAPPREKQATIERVRKRWKETDKRVACVGPEEFSWQLADGDPQRAGVARHVVHQSDFRSEDGPQSATSPPSTADDSLKTIRSDYDGKVSAAVTSVYDHADGRGMKSPNLNEIVRPVQTLLARNGLTATKTLIQEVAAQPLYKNRRRRPGPRVNGSLLPFSEAEM
jgi:hypothetical protein